MQSINPGFLRRLQQSGKQGLLNLAVAQCALAIARYLDGFGDPARSVSPPALEAAITSGRNPILDAVANAPPEGIAVVRRTFGAIAGDFRRSHGADGHPYMWVLQEDCLSVDHRAHVDVIMRHLPRYRQLMDQAVDWLFGSAQR